MKKLLTMIGAAAVAVGANADVVTNEVDGIKWQINIDTAKQTATLGSGNGSTYNDKRAIPAGFSGNNLFIPSSFTVDGVDYKTTVIGGRGFYHIYMENAVVPESITSINTYGFVGCSQLKNLLFKGPVSVSDGQTFESIAFGTSTYPVFSSCSAVKFVVIGPNVKTSSSGNFTLPSSKNATILAPRRADNTSWQNLTSNTLAKKSNGELKDEADFDTVLFYGPDYDFDMTMGETAMTFYPKTETALTNIISWASTFKSAFDMDTKIAITNRIEMSEGVQITEAMLQNVTLEAPPWYLTFAVKNQTQLNNVLAAVSADVPIIIDIEGAGQEPDHRSRRTQGGNPREERLDIWQEAGRSHNNVLLTAKM
ncbi:MAG: leucine-rich repeat protein [Victivallales bacterium]|nr:leucine-rich repeat protein [Victivallales bacterium]